MDGEGLRDQLMCAAAPAECFDHTSVVRAWKRSGHAQDPTAGAPESWHAVRWRHGLRHLRGALRRFFSWIGLDDTAARKKEWSPVMAMKELQPCGEVEFYLDGDMASVQDAAVAR